MAQGSEDKGPWFAGATAPFIALSTISIILRFCSRSLGQKHDRFWWDDWLSLLAWATGIVVQSISIAWTYRGLGKHVTVVSASDARAGLILLWASFIIFLVGIGLSKISVLLFYARVFTTSSTWFRRALWTTTFLSITWLVIFFCAHIFQCIPIHKFWDPETPGHCLSLYRLLFICGLCDVLLDVMILILPLPMVWRLQCGRVKKATILFAFICGYLGLVPSIGRFAANITQGQSVAQDFTYRQVPEMFWCSIELPIAVISICVPSCFYLFKRAYEFLLGYGLQSRQRNRGTNTSTQISSNPGSGGWRPRNDYEVDIGDGGHFDNQLGIELQDNKALIGRDDGRAI